MKNEKNKKKELNFFPIGIFSLDIFQLFTMASVKDKNGKFSWLKFFTILILLIIILPFFIHPNQK